MNDDEWRISVIWRPPLNVMNGYVLSSRPWARAPYLLRLSSHPGDASSPSGLFALATFRERTKIGR